MRITFLIFTLVYILDIIGIFIIDFKIMTVAYIGGSVFLLLPSLVVNVLHQEKWNGKGYPEGRSQKEIPLCARIMAIADVFDAVSEKRCYREAMPLDKCFDIISNGSGQDFDPILVEVFLDIRETIEAAHKSIINT